MANELTVKIVPQYPLDPKDVHETFSNNVFIYVTGEDVYFDFAQVQPQGIDPSVSDQVVSAQIRTRVVMGRAHANKFLKHLAELLQSATPSQEKS